MTEERSWATTPEEAYLTIERGFFGVVGERAEAFGSAADLERDIRAGQGEIEDRYASLVEDEQSRFHLRFAALALADGAPELTPVFCEWDTNWMDTVDPERHGFRFERPTTLGYGGDRCRFWFIRRDSEGGIRHQASGIRPYGEDSGSDYQGPETVT